jgi:4-amino-4-deoxy-L-arabinose transferase-like glycosyltransferase/Flp pilus assembly protein TadD
VIELRSAPFFNHPIGDSRIYRDRALEIAAGDILGRDAYFHSSPFYPYFLAGIFKVFGENLFVVRLIQILIGSLNCILVYQLTRNISGNRRGPPVLAGSFAALYGTFVFFDADLLMISLVLFFTCVSILALVTADERHRSQGAADGGVEKENAPRRGNAGGRRPVSPFVLFFVGGVSLGLAGLGKPNVLLFAPFAFWWILAGFGRKAIRGRWRAGFVFAAGAVIAVAPITARNTVVARDLVLVSSNAGVNFYIGNNSEATGIFFLPPSSGLDNARLYRSSRAAAEAATGRSDLKPSEVSRFWTGEGFGFIKNEPARALKLLGRKFLLFWNHYEIPNHHNKAFVETYFTPTLGFLPLGFRIVAPLAIAGIVFLLFGTVSRGASHLYFAFVLVYMVSLMPFFVTARYRLPVVPFLIVFAAVSVFGVYDAFRRRLYRWLAVALAAAGVAAVVVGWFIVDYDFAFSHTVVGTAYSDLATKEPERAPEHISQAIVEFKKALEIRPLFVDAHYNLGVAYQRVGYFSGAVRELETAAALRPGHLYASNALEESRAALVESGDRIDEAAIPKTPFESGLELSNRRMRTAAEAQYRKVLREDPHHPGAYSQLGAMRYEARDFKTAIEFFKRGLKYHPDHFVLNNNIAGAYYQTGDYGRARKHWEKCLEKQPDNPSVLKQLRLIEAK